MPGDGMILLSAKEGQADGEVPTGYLETTLLLRNKRVNVLHARVLTKKLEKRKCSLVTVAMAMAAAAAAVQKLRGPEV